MSIVRIDERGGAVTHRPHLTKRGGVWMVSIRVGVSSGVFAAMRWADWKNGRHDWYANPRYNK